MRHIKELRVTGRDSEARFGQVQWIRQGGGRETRQDPRR